MPLPNLTTKEMVPSNQNKNTVSKAFTCNLNHLRTLITTMDCLQLKYRLFSEQNAERTLFVRVYKLVDDEEKADRVLEVLNVPFFVEESDLKSLFKSENVQIKFTVVKATSDKLRSKTALVEFASKKELKNELRLIKYSDESEKLFLYKTKVFRMNFD